MVSEKKQPGFPHASYLLSDQTHSYDVPTSKPYSEYQVIKLVLLMNFFSNSVVKITKKIYIQYELFSFTKQCIEAGAVFLISAISGQWQAGISEVLRIYFDILIGLLPGMIRHSINNWLELFGCFHQGAHNIGFFLFLL